MVEADDYDDDGVSLKPCPFCGSPAEKLELTEEDGPHNAGGSVISCVKCQASSAVEFNFKETLRERWNSRTALSLPPVDVCLAAQHVLAERRRQVEEEGWTAEHDDVHTDESLSQAAACYALHTAKTSEELDHSRDGATRFVPEGWPRSWGIDWWKPKDRRSNLVKAGALILAEIERLDRLPPPPQTEETR